MSMIETIEYFPLFNAEPGEEPPRAAVAIGSGVAAVGVPDALGGAGALVIYFYSPIRNAWGYVGVLSGSKIEGSEQVRALGSSCVAFGDTVVVGAPGDRNTPGRVFVLSPPYGAWTLHRRSRSSPNSATTSRPRATGLAPPSPIARTARRTTSRWARPEFRRLGARQEAVRYIMYQGLEASRTPWSTSPIANPNTAGTADDQFGATRGHLRFR